MRPFATLARCFSPLLVRLGFVQRRPHELSYFAELLNPSRRLHVDIECHDDIDAFRLVLQVHSAEGQRFELLESFEGLHYYQYDPHSPKAVRRSVALALRHFRRYGVPWLRGEPVLTPALELRAIAAQDAEVETFLSHGREAFRSGRFADALRELESAQRLRALDRTSAEYLRLAAKRVAQTGGA